jgi:hypothetical protein
MQAVPTLDEPRRDPEDDAKGGPETESDIGEAQLWRNGLRPWMENDA